MTLNHLWLLIHAEEDVEEVCIRQTNSSNICFNENPDSSAVNSADSLHVTAVNPLCSQLLEQVGAQEGLISRWTFPGERLQGDGTGDVAQRLKGYMELLRNKVVLRICTHTRAHTHVHVNDEKLF